MSILAMDILEMTSSKGIGIQICPFPICPFYDKPHFLPDPKQDGYQKCGLALTIFKKEKISFVYD
jgi:hypothetical protein